MSDRDDPMATAQAKADKYQGLFAESTIQRELRHAAAEGGAYNPDQILPFLVPSAKLVESGGQYLVRVITTNEAGQEVAHSPAEAVANLKRCKENENLFKSERPAPAAPAKAEKLDVRKLTHEQFLDIRAKNPELLGLAPKRR
jgi:hypothetical protein